MMADFMSHGGDGVGNPQFPPFGSSGSHQTDVVPPQKTRGKAKNKKLAQELLKHKGEPLSLTFDRDATFTPVGERHDMFVREVGIYMERNYAFNKRSWDNLSDGQKNDLQEHMKRLFDFDEIERDCESLKLKGGVRTIFLKSFSRHKAILKQHFLKVGGYENLEQSRATTPVGMSDENWNKTIDHFLTDEYRKQSSANKANRQKQQYINHGGTSSYSSFCYKKNKSRLEAFHHANTNDHGNFYSELAKEQHSQINTLFQDPIFMARLSQFMDSKKVPDHGDEDDFEDDFDAGYD